MDEEIRYFVTYLEDVKKASHNTVMSYQSDLVKMMLYARGLQRTEKRRLRYGRLD